MKLNIPMRLVGPLDRNSLINQLGMPGGNGMRITGAYNTQSLLRQFGSQNAVGYGMNPLNGMNGMGMAAIRVAKPLPIFAALIFFLSARGVPV